MHTKTQYYPDRQQFSAAAAEFLCRQAQQSVTEHGSFTLALSGGSTPRSLYECLAQTPYVKHIPWEKTYLFWGDERYVPFDHTDSNAAMASRAFIEKVPIPPEHVRRIPTEAASPEIAAEEYERSLRKLLPVFDPSSERKELPVFDLILLGMGPDGHTASLFPDSPVLDETERWVSATSVPRLNPPLRRITLTFPVINAAKCVLFLISGSEKQAILNAIQGNRGQTRQSYPAARVQPEEGQLLYFVTR